MRPSLAEMLILTVLLGASISSFWFRFRKVVRTIRAAKPEKTWRLLPVAPRIGRFIWEVLLQGKVIFDRPIPGLAHAFVFWGFCAFALVTINHVAAGFGDTLISLLPLIPHTKHLHLVLSPLTIFAGRDGFSKIPPLADDEDFGLDTGKDVTKLIALQAYTCVECGRCTEFCPAYNTGKVLNPKEIILGMREYLNELGPRSDEPLLGKYISSEAAFQCTTCGGCEYSCPVGIQHLPVIIGLRRGAVNTGKWEDDYGTKLFLTLERNGNSLGLPSSERQKFIEKHELPIFDGTQEYCLWLGCMGAYDPHGREIVLAFTRVLRHLGITFGVLRKEKCSGDPIRRLGNDYLYSQLAEPNIQHLNESGVKKMVSICPHCVWTIGEDWKEFGASFQIEHHSELMARNPERLPVPDGVRESVVYHDPCYLGRYRNIYDEPRSVIERFADQCDPPRARERSFCCGAGGGQMFLSEEKGKRINMARAEELAATGGVNISASPERTATSEVPSSRIVMR